MIGERVLLALSRDPGEPDRAVAVDAWSIENALDLLRRHFPGFEAMVEGRRVLDFGCGTGWQAAALAKRGAEHVLGVETNPRSLAAARALAARLGIDGRRLEFRDSVPEEQRGSFDLVISQNSMEHFADPAAVLSVMRDALKPTGRLLVTFGPPWFAPSGSHMHFFTNVPWVHLIFSEETVMRVRSRYRSDGARRYEEVESGLNRMSLRKFERLVAGCGLEMRHRDYHAVRGYQLLGRIPLVRELFVNNVACTLVPAGRSRTDPRPEPRESLAVRRGSESPAAARGSSV